MMVSLCLMQVSRSKPCDVCKRWGQGPFCSRLPALHETSSAILPFMKAKAITPILNVSDIAASFAWFEKWGWKKCWDWGTPPTFGAVGSGACEIFLCQGGQGGRGRGSNFATFGPDGDQTADKGAWMSVWIEDVDEAHRQCQAAGLDITFPPTNMPWNVREMHLRHPDGHVFRVSKGLEESAEE